MIFSDRLLFLHVPKTGGSSVVQYLLETLPRPVYYSLPPDHEADVPPGVIRFHGIAHETLGEARLVLAERSRRLEDVPVVVACVRNPYELEVSRFAYLRRDLNSYNHGLQQAVALLGDFELFAMCSRVHGGRPLESYFVLDGVVPPNLRIIKLESIERDLARCLAEAGVGTGAAKIPHHNRSAHDPFPSYYTPAAEQAVYEKYKWIFDAGLYPRLPHTDEHRPPSEFESSDAVDRLVESMIGGLDEQDDFGRANVWLGASEIHRRWLRTDAQYEALERALSHASHLDSDRLVGWTIHELSRCRSLSGMGTVNEGIESCTTLLETPGFKRGAPGTRLVLAELLAAVGRFEEARAMCDEVAAGGAQFELSAASAAGSVELLAGDAEAAETRFRHGWWSMPGLVGDRAEALYRLGRYAEAEPLARFTELTAPASDSKTQARWRRMRGKLLARAGKSTAAAELVREAVAIVERCQAPNLQADALVDLAEVLALGGREDESAGALEEAIRRYEHKGNVASARHAADLLRDLQRAERKRQVPSATK
jgi:tetratricopeptide (TPR) repeat protein